jgi:zinc protease
MRSDATAPAVEEMFKEIERIRTAPPTIEELKLSKGAFSLSLAGLFESSEQTANTVGDLFTYDLPLDYYQQLPAKIDAVTAQDAQRMANTYLHPETSVVIGAGDRSKIEESLKKLAIGPVELRDADGNPVKAAAAAGQAH